MANQSYKKVRLVKCPRCEQILPELVSIPIYRCGGCGTFLQAKRPDYSTRALQQKDVANTNSENGLELSNDKDAQSSSQAAVSTGGMIKSTEVENHGIKESSFDCEAEKSVDQEHTADDEVLPVNQQRESDKFLNVASIQNREQLEENCEVDLSAEFVQQDNEKSSPSIDNYNESLPSDASFPDENDELPLTIGNIVNEDEERCVEDLKLNCRGDSNGTLEVSPSIKVSQVTGSDEFERDCARDVNPSVIIVSSEEPSPTHGTNTDPDQHPSSSNSSLSVYRLSADTNLEPPYSLPNDQPGKIAHRSLHSNSSDETIGNSSVYTLDAPAAYYSYEGSLSSFDGIGSQAPLRRLHQTRNFSPFENSYEEPEYRRYDHPVRSPYNRPGPSAHPNNRFLDNGSTCTCGCNELQHKPSFDLVNRLQHAEEKKMELLDMISELQDQLNYMPAPMENVKGKVTYHQNTNYSRRRIHSRERQISRMAFSAEAPYSRHQMEPRTMHYSAELPPYQIRSNGGNYHRPSIHSGPQNLSNSPQLSSDWNYDDICHKNNNVMKNLIKDRLHSGKKHVRPTVGGAPFVVCYHCQKLLELPTDFHISKDKKFHRLRCGSCSNVLRFCFENDSSMMPKMEKTCGVTAPPPSEVNIQFEKPKPTSRYTLHKLMGYSSPSQGFFHGKITGLKQRPHRRS